MNLGVRESVALARGILRYMRGKDSLPDLILCPSFTALSEVYKATARSRSQLCAQNCGPEYRNGAYTGEISPSQLEDVHASYVLIGHSERRQFFGEEDDIIVQRYCAANDSKLIPILCVGETKEEHGDGKAQNVVIDQVAAVLKHVDISSNKPVFIAYEPVWAIGSGSLPAASEIVAMHQLIRQKVAILLDRGEDTVKVLYGGSVTDENAYTLLREREIDGLLIGGASLRLQSFTGIIDAAQEVITAQEK